jgi:hypothetical protein
LIVNAAYAFGGGFRYTFATKASDAVDPGGLDMTIDANNVYWVGGPDLQTIYSLPQSFVIGAVPKTVASAMMQVRGLASDGTVAMWTSPSTQTLVVEAPVIAAGGAVYWAHTDADNNPSLTSTIWGIAAP